MPDNNEIILIRERLKLLAWLEDTLEIPMLILGFVWLLLLIIEFGFGTNQAFETLGSLIWVVFVVDFTVKFVLATKRLRYLRSNWLTVIALFIPALRVFRVTRAVKVLRLARTARSFRLVRVVSSINRGMRALGKTMQRRGVSYVIALTLIVTFSGAAGMYTFESNPGGIGLNDYPTALWWTSMIMLTLGSDYWPQSLEGRILCILLALYAFAVLGYVTATIASYFIGRDAASKSGEVAGSSEIRELRNEIRALREVLEARGGGEGL